MLEALTLAEHPRPSEGVTLAIGWGKSKRRSYLFEKAVELHGLSLAFWTARRSQGQMPTEPKDSWREKCVQAAKQCGNPHVPDIFLLQGNDDLLQFARDFDQCYVAWEADEARTPLTPENLAKGKSLVVIGPEGGLETEEVTGLLDKRIFAGNPRGQHPSLGNGGHLLSRSWIFCPSGIEMKLEIEESQPLADRIRPTTLDEFVGQGHIRNRIEAFTQSKRLPSLLLFGPPGCGKSTLALLLAKITGKKSLRVSAPEAGLTALRKRLPGHDILILDELHRFSKAQQDFFLPLLETGEIILLATTTENPSFSVTRQLLSRLHVLRLRPLSRDELVQVAHRGADELDLELDEECYQILSAMGGGDARTLLNLLEYTAELPKAKRTPEKLRESLPEIVVRGDRGRRLPLRTRLGADQVHPGQRPGRGPVLPGLSPGKRRGPPVRDPAVDHLRLGGYRAGQIRRPCPRPWPATRPSKPSECLKDSSPWPRR